MSIFTKIFQKAGNNTDHIATISAPEGDYAYELSVQVDENGEVIYEHPEVIHVLEAKFHNNKRMAVVLRTFDRGTMAPAPWKPEITVPMKTVRMWLIDNKMVIPISESDAFAASTKSYPDGEPVPPEETVKYAAGWEV